MPLDAIRSFFSRRLDPERGENTSDRVAVAACALLLELAHADEGFSEPERARILRAAREMGVPEADLEELLRIAEEERRGSVDLFGFTREVASRFSREDRLRLVEAIWGVVYSDGSLSETENRLARRIAEMLGFQHPEVQAVKDQVARRTP